MSEREEKLRELIAKLEKQGCYCDVRAGWSCPMHGYLREVEALMGDREQKLRELIAKWREWARSDKGTAVAHFAVNGCADELESLLAEPHPAPVVTVTQGAPPGCTADAIAQSGKWQTFGQPAPPSVSAVDIERLANKHNTSDKWNINFSAFTADLNALLGAAKPAEETEQEIYEEGVSDGLDEAATNAKQREAELRDRVLEEAAQLFEKYGEVYETEIAMIRALKSQVSVTGQSKEPAQR